MSIWDFWEKIVEDGHMDEVYESWEEQSEGLAEALEELQLPLPELSGAREEQTKHLLYLMMNSYQGDVTVFVLPPEAHEGLCLLDGDLILIMDKARVEPEISSDARAIHARSGDLSRKPERIEPLISGIRRLCAAFGQRVELPEVSSLVAQHSRWRDYRLGCFDFDDEASRGETQLELLSRRIVGIAAVHFENDWF